MKTEQKTFQEDSDPIEIFDWLTSMVFQHTYETEPRDPADRMIYTDKKKTIKFII